MALKACLVAGLRFSQGNSVLAALHRTSQAHASHSSQWGAVFSYSAVVPALSVQPLPNHFGLAAKPETANAVYRVTVVTGRSRGAGTNSAAVMKLIGSTAESDKFIIGDSEMSGFARGSVKTFEVTVPEALGCIRRVVVEKAKASAGEIADGWFLQHVEVTGPQGEQWLFPCHSWLGQSDCGGIDGTTERNLLPGSTTNLANEEVQPGPVTVQASGIAIPHPEKVMKGGIRGVNKQHYGYGGEDAYFFCHGRNEIFGMGVADGVYMWKEQGIDSGAMSRALMQSALRMVQAGHEDVLSVLQAAAQHVTKERLQGSSTISLLTINKAQGVLHSANLGDSGFIVVGPTSAGGSQLAIKFRTNQLEHEFGCPFQLGHQATADTPEDADLATFPVVKGDIIVMGTDGMLDNLSDADVLQEVAHDLSHNASKASSSRLAQRLIKVAFDSSMDKHKMTPYSRAASEAFDMCYSGGKKDDITVLVACIN